jgi:hypothetical protein
MSDPQQPAPAPYTAQDLYGPTGRPQASDIEQHNIGDCFFISPLGALAHEQPERIQNAITYNPNTQSFTVTLYQHDHTGFLWLTDTPKPTQIEVTQADIQKDIARGGDSLAVTHPGTKEPMWGAVVEAAYAKMSEKSGETLDNGFDHINKGGYSADAVYALTGEQVNTLSASDAKDLGVDGTYQKLNQALQEGRPILLDTSYMANKPTDGLVKGDKESVGPFGLFSRESGHSYMLEGISKDAHGNVELTLRNPWGNNNYPAQGVTSQDPLVHVDLKTILDNGHLSDFSIGPSAQKAHEETQDKVHGANTHEAPTQTQSLTGDPAFDHLLASVGNDQAFSQAMTDFAQSPAGQAFHAEGQAQYADLQNQQTQAQQQSQSQQQAQSGPAMTM